MTQYVRRSLVSLAAASALVTGVALPANAATNNQNGLINVGVGNVTVQDINIGVAAQGGAGGGARHCR
jgi:hypothetical protein